MKNLLIATFMIASTVTADAGSLAFTPPQAATIEEPARMGGSGAWIVPLVIVAVIVLAASSKTANPVPACATHLGQNNNAARIAC